MRPALLTAGVEMMAVRVFPCPACGYSVAIESEVCPRCEHIIGFLEGMQAWTTVVRKHTQDDEGDLTESTRAIPLTNLMSWFFVALIGQKRRWARSSESYRLRQQEKENVENRKRVVGSNDKLKSCCEMRR